MELGYQGVACHELYLENFGSEHPLFSTALAFYGYKWSSLSLTGLLTLIPLYSTLKRSVNRTFAVFLTAPSAPVSRPPAGSSQVTTLTTLSLQKCEKVPPEMRNVRAP